MAILLNESKAVFTVILLAVFCSGAACGGGEDDRLFVEGVMEPAGSKVEKIDVFDACGAPALARMVAEELLMTGYTVGEVRPARDANGRIDYSYAETVVRYGPACLNEAEVVAHLFNAGVEPGPGLTDRLEVYVGGRTKDPPEAPENGFYIDLSDRVLYYYDDGARVGAYPCAVGKPETTTPTGIFTTGAKSVDPVWYWEGRAIPPGPENGLGTRFISFANAEYPTSYGVHGTNEPDSIGIAASHGCVRMYNEDIEALFPMVDAGEKVIIVE